MTTAYRLAIVGQDPKECEQFRAALSGEPYEIEIVQAPDAGAFTYDSRRFDLCLLCLPKGYPSGEGVHTASAAIGGNFIYVMTSPTEEQQHWAYRQGAVDVAVRPQSQNEIRYRVERALLTRTEHVETMTSEAVLLDVLKSLADAQVKSIEPVPDPTMPLGYAYPEVEFVLGRSPIERECLEYLAMEGFLTRTLHNRVRTCPTCADFRMNFREVCPKCSSINITRKEIVHHFRCAHVGTLESFRQGGDLVCPKCNQTLRQIGLDYDKPADHWSCEDCEFIFPDPVVEVQCLRCAQTCDPEDTLPQPIYRYGVTPLVQEAVAEGRIGGVSLSTILRNKYTGLYSRQYFEHEVMRELARSTRYSMPYSLLLIRIDGLEDVRRKNPAQVDEYATAIFAAVSHGLRTLDTTCVWDRDMVGVLLPGTHDAGADVVAQRMKERVAELDYLKSIGAPRISVGMVSNKDKFNSYQEALDAAHQKLQ